MLLSVKTPSERKNFSSVFLCPGKCEQLLVNLLHLKMKEIIYVHQSSTNGAKCPEHFRLDGVCVRWLYRDTTGVK